jgi:hypothetical protein
MGRSQYLLYKWGDIIVDMIGDINHDKSGYREISWDIQPTIYRIPSYIIIYIYVYIPHLEG